MHDEANGRRACARVDANRGVIVYVDMTAKREAEISYGEFDMAKAK